MNQERQESFVSPERLRIVRDIYNNALSLLEIHAEQRAIGLVPKEVAARHGFGDSIVLIREDVGYYDELDRSDEPGSVPGIRLKLYKLRNADARRSDWEDLAKYIEKHLGRVPELVEGIREIGVRPEENGETACGIDSHLSSPQDFEATDRESMISELHGFMDSLKLQRQLGLRKVDTDERRRLLAMIDECLAIARQQNSEEEYEQAYGRRASQLELRTLRRHINNLLADTTRLVIPDGIERHDRLNFFQATSPDFSGPGPGRDVEIPYKDLIVPAQDAVKELRIAGPVTVDSSCMYMLPAAPLFTLPVTKIRFPVPGEDGLDTREFAMVESFSGLLIARTDGHVPTNLMQPPISPADGHPISVAECQALTQIFEKLATPKSRWRRALGRIGIDHWTHR